MLNRRYLRVKVFQALYMYFQSPGVDINYVEKEMFKSIEKIYDLYLLMLLLLVELKDTAFRNIEQSKEKKLPEQEDLHPNTKFVDNRFFHQLENNSQFKKLIESKKINWQSDQELIRKLFRIIKNSDEYAAYMSSANSGFETDKNFIIKIFKKYISDYELLEQFFEDKSIYWVDDIGLVNVSVLKTIQGMHEVDSGQQILFKLYKDEEEDRKFIKQLLRKTILNHNKYEITIAEKAKNWEMERIALLDAILMQMAMCEFEEFPDIPIKVTMNEYIELSKSYSTPKSRTFINGILDKVVADWKSNERIVKKGRGLVE